MAKKSSSGPEWAAPKNSNAMPAWRWLRTFTDRTKRVLVAYVDEFTRRSQDPPTTPITRNKVQRQLSDFRGKLDQLISEFDLRYAEFRFTDEESSDPDFAGIREALDSMANGGFHQTLRMIRDEISDQAIKASQPLSPDEEKAFWKSIADFIPAVRTMIEACRRAKQLLDGLIRSGKHASSPLERKLLQSGEQLLGDIISAMERCMDSCSPYQSVRDDADISGLVHPSAAELLASKSESIDLYLTYLDKRLASLTEWTAAADAAGVDTENLELADLRSQLRSHLALDATVFTAARQIISSAIRLPASAAEKANQASTHLDRVTAAHREALARCSSAVETDHETTTSPTKIKKPIGELNAKELLVIDYLYSHESMPSYTIADLADPIQDLAEGGGFLMAKSTLRYTLKSLVNAKWVIESKPKRSAAESSPPFQYSLSPAGRAAYAAHVTRDEASSRPRNRPHSGPAD